MNLIAVLLRGEQPNLREVVFLRTAFLHGGLSVFQPQDLRAQITAGNHTMQVMSLLLLLPGASHLSPASSSTLQEDVVNALVRELQGFNPPSARGQQSEPLESDQEKATSSAAILGEVDSGVSLGAALDYILAKNSAHGMAAHISAQHHHSSVLENSATAATVGFGSITSQLLVANPVALTRSVRGRVVPESINVEPSTSPSRPSDDSNFSPITTIFKKAYSVVSSPGASHPHSPTGGPKGSSKQLKQSSRHASRGSPHADISAGGADRPRMSGCGMPRISGRRPGSEAVLLALGLPGEEINSGASACSASLHHSAGGASRSLMAAQGHQPPFPGKASLASSLPAEGAERQFVSPSSIEGEHVATLGNSRRSSVVSSVLHPLVDAVQAPPSNEVGFIRETEC